MDHLVLDADGTCDRRTNRLDWGNVLGPGDRTRVPIHSPYESTAWVNRAARLDPAAHPVNVVGSWLLITAGAPARRYRGRIVLTGWAPDLLTTGVCGLGRYGDELADLHRNVLRALADQDTDLPALTGAAP